MSLLREVCITINFLKPTWEKIARRRKKVKFRSKSLVEILLNIINIVFQQNMQNRLHRAWYNKNDLHENYLFDFTLRHYAYSKAIMMYEYRKNEDYNLQYAFTYCIATKVINETD